jgi:hypothetical protein
MAEKNIFKSCLDFVCRQADSVLSPEARDEAYQKANRFARDQPVTFVSLNFSTAHLGPVALIRTSCNSCA